MRRLAAASGEFGGVVRKKFTRRRVPAGSDDAGRRDVAGQRRNERLVSDVRSESFGMLGRPEGQGPRRSVVVHGCNGKSTPLEPTEDAVR